MKQTFASLSVLALILLAGCSKDLALKQNSQISSSPDDKIALDNDMVGGTLDTSRGWYGFYSGSFVQSDTIPDSELIANGVAKVPFTTLPIDFTNIGYDIPAEHHISGDSMIFETRIKNPKDEGFYDYDVVLQIHGSKHFAQLQFVADASSQQYSNVYVGNASHSNLPNLVYDFSDYRILKFVFRNDHASVFIGSNLVYSFNYGSENEIGDLKSIYIAGKGYMTCDKVRLINSYNAKRILTEDFNTDGKSTIIYY